MNIAIIGSNRGIGLELVKQYVQAGHNVYAFCRRSSADLEQVKPKKIITGFDVQEFTSAKHALNTIKDIHFDQVIHVSGILKGDRLETLDETGLLKQFHVNAIGPILSFKSFLPFMNKGTKFSILSSRVGSIADNSSGNNYGYRMSKAAVNMAAKNLSIDAKDKEITVLILHPGYVKTDMTQHTGNISATESAQQLIKLIEEKSFADTGTFWHANGEALPW
ncbi:MAG TPA: SDR family oxidoreductase [Oligoflexia bacterium]|nr:SDR family oxidoreductase [Oligoflexia bacterium]HMR24266.1 SDR family oxidoreductase [Oligoflexia bacterium]